MHSETEGRALVRRVDGRIRGQGLIGGGETVLVACSGGPDSVCLLTILSKLQEEWHWRLLVGHVDHGMRLESEQERIWVKRLATSLGLPFFWRRVDVLPGSEDEARRARYEALEAMAEEAGASVVALGHHGGDQAETVLMKLLRGTGLRGAAGMPARRGRFVRPLLGETRETIEAVLEEWGIEFLSDPSNADERYLRNWVRHRVLPLLHERNPRVVPALAEFAHRQRQDLETMDRAMELLADRYSKRVAGPEGLIGVRIEGSVLDDLGPGGLWWHLRRAHALVREPRRIEGPRGLPTGDKQLSANHLGHIETLLGLAGEKRVSLPGGVAAVTVPGGIAVLPVSWTASPEGGRWLLEPGRGLVRLLPTGWVLEAGSSPVVVSRAWKGARLRSGGKLQDLYVDLRIPKIVRSHLPLVVSQGKVDWAVGRRAGARRLFLVPGSLEHALVRLCWPSSEDHGIFDLSRTGLSVTTKAMENTGHRVLGEDSQSAGSASRIGDRKA